MRSSAVMLDPLIIPFKLYKMAKKRKLNSKNPKYRPATKEVVDTTRHELITVVKGVKVYATFK